MAIDIPNLFRGLGSVAMAFADPRQSLLMSQGVYRDLEAARERRRQEEEQARRQEEQRRRWEATYGLQQDRLQLAQDEFAATQAQELAQQQSGQRLAAALGGAPMAAMRSAAYEPEAMAATQAVYRPGQTAPLAAAPPMLGQRPLERAAQPTEAVGALPAAFQKLSPAAQAATMEMARMGDTQGALKYMAAQGKDPALVRTVRALQNADPQTQALMLRVLRLQGGVGEGEVRAPARYHPTYGYAGEGRTWVYNEETGTYAQTPIRNSANEIIGYTPTLVDLQRKGASAEQVKMQALADTGKGNIEQIRGLLDKHGWDFGTKAGYVLNFPGTAGESVRRYFSDTKDVISKSRTGAASNAQEQVEYDRIFGLSVFHSREDVDKRLGHMERALDVYDAARKKLDIAPDEPLPADVQAEADRRVREDPNVNPYYLEGYNYIGHDPQGRGVIYELNGRRFRRPYESFE